MVGGWEARASAVGRCRRELIGGVGERWDGVVAGSLRSPEVAVLDVVGGWDARLSAVGPMQAVSLYRGVGRALGRRRHQRAAPEPLNAHGGRG